MNFKQLLHRENSVVVCVLFVAVAFNLVLLYPEVAVNVLSGNDMGMHYLATDMAVGAINLRNDFTDPWQSTIGMGFPLFHHYQHLAHISIALVHVITFGVFPIVDMVDWATYLFLCVFPLSIFWSMRLFGFDRLSAAMGGLVASLTSAPSLYGLDFSSYVSQGFGLYAQLWAMLLLPPSLGFGYRVLRDGRGYFWTTLFLVATLLSHLIYGYMAFLTLGALTLIQPLQSLNARSIVGSVWTHWRRLLVLFLLVLIVSSYFLVPFFLDRPYLNVSIWNDPTKFNSYGHFPVLRSLAKGYLFDFGRLPSLTVLIAVGIVICLLRSRQGPHLIPLTIFLLWLLLYFGRPTWGALLDLLPLTRDLQIHRFIGGVHLGGIYLAAVALATIWQWAVSRPAIWYLLVPMAVTFVILSPVYLERVVYLQQNALGMRESQRALASEDQELSALFEKLKQLPPGRVYAGQNHPRLKHWGSQYRVGNAPVYVLLQAKGFDMLGSKYHRYSLNRDLEINFDEYLWEQYNLFNVRYVVAPESKKFPEFVRPLQQFGRHRLYQVDTTGYFDLVGSKLAFTGESKDFFLAASSWLASGLPRVKQHPQVTIGRFGRSDEHSVPLSAAIEVIPEADVSASTAQGSVWLEKVGNDFFAADVTVERNSLLLLKVTYHPNLRATLNGVETDTIMLMPSFVGVHLSPGDHQVRMEYRPRQLRLILLILGMLTLPLIALSEMRGKALYSWIVHRTVGSNSNSEEGRDS